MLKGAMIGLVSDEIGIDMPVAVDVHEHVFGYMRTYEKVSRDVLAKFLVAICVKSCGSSAMKAGNVARDEGNGLVAQMCAALSKGEDFTYHLNPPTAGLIVGARISGDALRRIAIAAGVAADLTFISGISGEAAVA